MISTSKLKFVKSLGVQKFRKIHQLFVVEGPKMMDELFDSEFVPVEVFATTAWLDENKKKVSVLQQKIVEVSDKEISRLSGLKTANKVLATVKIPDRKISEKDFNKLLLVLDGISDPGNLGTIIRTADWFGIRNLLCSADCVELYNPKAVQASMGSLFRVKVFYNDLEQIIAKFGKNIPVIGTTLDGENIFNMQLPDQAMIIIGSESHGIRETSQKLLTQRIMIPAIGPDVESLNAAVATGIICSEFMRNSLK